MNTTLLNLSEFIKNILEGTAILGAATWTIFRFGIFRERYAKIEFNLECRYIGLTDDSIVLELIAVIENKGLVRQTIKEWTFDLLLFMNDDSVDESEQKINYQVKFPNKKIDKRPWVPTSWYSTFIDSGTKQVYPYLTSVPKDTAFITIYSRFIYPNTRDFHSSQKTFNLKTVIEQTHSAKE